MLLKTKKGFAKQILFVVKSMNKLSVYYNLYV